MNGLKDGVPDMKIRFKDLQLVILCPQNWSSLNASFSSVVPLLVFILVPSICHPLTIRPSTVYPFIYLCMHPCIHPSLHPSIPPSILSVHPFIPHPSIQLPIHSSTIHSLSIQPPSIIYHACVYPPAIIYSSLSIRSCTIYPCVQDLPICVPSIHRQSSVYPSSHHSPTILLYGSVHPSILPSTHSSTYPSTIHFSIHYLSIIYLLSTLRGARCSSALRESPVCWG